MDDVVEVTVADGLEYLFDVVGDHRLRVDVALRGPFYNFETNVRPAHVFKNHVQISG